MCTGCSLCDPQLAREATAAREAELARKAEAATASDLALFKVRLAALERARDDYAPGVYERKRQEIRRRHPDAVGEDDLTATAPTAPNTLGYLVNLWSRDYPQLRVTGHVPGEEAFVWLNPAADPEGDDYRELVHITVREGEVTMTVDPWMQPVAARWLHHWTKEVTPT